MESADKIKDLDSRIEAAKGELEKLEEERKYWAQFKEINISLFRNLAIIVRY